MGQCQKRFLIFSLVFMAFWLYGQNYKELGGAVQKN